MMQKKEYVVYFAVQGKHSYGNVFVTKKMLFRNENHTKILTLTFLVVPVV